MEAVVQRRTDQPELGTPTTQNVDINSVAFCAYFIRLRNP
jgi:hypothetical protein